MRDRLALVMTALTTVGLLTGVAWAAIPANPASEQVIEAGEAGSVLVATDGTVLEVTEVLPAPGWSGEVEVPTGREVEVDFRNGTRRIQFNAGLEDGVIRVRLREGTATGGTSTTVGDTSSTTQDATSTTIDNTSSTTSDDSTSTTVGDTSSTTQDTTSTTIDDTTSTSVDDDTPTGSGSETYTLSGVATISVSWSDGRMHFDSMSLSDGWMVERQDLRSDRVKLEFENGDSEARFEAKFHDGALRVEMRVD
ncbi:MAG: hypothetical protein OEX04_03300 [Acidimicrobiia bacterium]|nr:hypothetical protein [Acidimicrobiia bacterium]MDH4306482.1 hypothetical protein [Acidimicrobiia bacterium]MDH5293110.1 hypothetical protein [Acidimicrobiia bacterium]